MENKTQKHYKVGIVIGRFQPFHNGHQYLLKEALKIADKIIIGIGSSNVKNADNPWTSAQRKEVIEKIIAEEDISENVVKIVEIPDHPDDEEWYKITMERAGVIDVSIGNNDWVNGILKRHKVAVVEVPFFKRYLNEGVKIRKLMKEGKNWQNRVPPYIIPIL